MKEKIIAKARDMFLKLGFKSVTMDDIAGEMCISKKTIYKFFCNKEILIKEATRSVHNHVMEIFKTVQDQNFNPVEENFEIRKTFDSVFIGTDNSPVFQLKKHYPEIYEEVMRREEHECFQYIRHNLERGIAQGYYRNDISVENAIRFYWSIMLHINETEMLEKDAKTMELSALCYHTRAISTDKGLEELEKQLSINI